MDVLHDVCEILAEQTHTPVAEMNADTRLESLGVQSVDVIEILFRLEEKFGIEIPINANDETVATFETIGSITDAVKKLIAAKSPK